MKTSTSIATVALIASATLFSTTALARPDYDSNRHGKTDRYADQQTDRYSDKYDRHDRRSSRYANRDVLRLDIPVRVRGSDRIPLRRLVKRYHRVDLSQYRLKKVVVSNNRRRHASANLRVGDVVTYRQRLRRGNNHIHAPRRSDGRWVLGVKHARVDNIRVVLEPKHGWAKHHSPRRHQRPWFAQLPHRW